MTTDEKDMLKPEPYSHAALFQPPPPPPEPHTASMPTGHALTAEEIDAAMSYTEPLELASGVEVQFVAGQPSARLQGQPPPPPIVI